MPDAPAANGPLSPAPPIAAPPGPVTTGGSTHLALLVVSLCFATFPVAGKWAMEGFEPRVVSSWRVIVGATVLMALARRAHPREFLLPMRDLWTTAWLSLLGVTINQILYIEGLKRSSATTAGLFMTVIPVMTYAVSLALGRERIDARKVLGIFIAAAGVVTLFAAKGARLAADHRSGDIMVILNATSYAVYLVLAKPLLARRPAIVVIAWIFFFGALVVPLTAIGSDFWPHAPAKAEWSLLWVLLFPTITAYGLNTWALGRTDASIVGIYVCLQPIINMVLAAIFLGEHLTQPSAIAGALVLLGVWCVTGRRRRRGLIAPT